MLQCNIFGHHREFGMNISEGIDRMPLLSRSNAFAKKLTVTKITDVQLHTSTKIIHPLD